MKVFFVLSASDVLSGIVRLVALGFILLFLFSLESELERRLTFRAEARQRRKDQKAQRKEDRRYARVLHRSTMHYLQEEERWKRASRKSDRRREREWRRWHRMHIPWRCPWHDTLEADLEGTVGDPPRDERQRICCRLIRALDRWFHRR
jgi:hypothetical protein